MWDTFHTIEKNVLGIWTVPLSCNCHIFSLCSIAIGVPYPLSRDFKVYLMMNFKVLACPTELLGSKPVFFNFGHIVNVSTQMCSFT